MLGHDRTDPVMLQVSMTCISGSSEGRARYWGTGNSFGVVQLHVVDMYECDESTV